ncbi:MAG: SIS domain-containing protein [Fimbriimonadaceae bacterium]|nr:SIS domain-containing protein [Fimbriimonadaceae bacterium]
MAGVFARSFFDAERLMREFRSDESAMATLDDLAARLTQCFRDGNKVMAAGNGGSHADALHFCEEWTGRFKKDRVPLPAIALGEATHMTCVGNDYGFEHGLSRLVTALAKPGDMLVLLSTSGNSDNLVLAAQASREAGARTVGFLGRGGGRLAPLCDDVVMAPGETSDRIQEVHMCALHAWIEEVEVRLGVAGV